MSDNLPLSLRMFNDRVRVMTQSNAKILTLNANEAHSLHTEIYSLLTLIAELSKNNNAEPLSGQISMDGGGFK